MNKKVLIVSQDTSLITTLKFEFESQGATVRSCTSKALPEEALSWFPQVVIVDAGLPGQESLKLCRTLKHSKQLCTISLIYLGEVMNVKAMSAAYKAGIDFYVLKQGEDYRALHLAAEAVFRLEAQAITAA